MAPLKIGAFPPPLPSKKEELKQLVVSWEASTEALLILFVAFVLGLAGEAVQCYEFVDCYEKGTCNNASRWRTAGLSCSFTNAVSVEADMMYGGGNGTFTSLTRSICAPGERLHINSRSGQSECAPYRAWPNALNTEIMNPGAATKHEQMCGAWIDAGRLLSQQTYYWSFYDQSKANLAVSNVERGIYSSTRLSSTDMGKFYTSCSQTVLGGTGAIRASAKKAYQHLVAGAPTASNVEQVLKNVGWLASHACDGPVLSGMTEANGVFKASMGRGSAFQKGALARSLYTVEESIALQTLAESANDDVNRVALSSPSATIGELEDVFEGATGRTDHETILLQYTVTPELDGLIWLATQARFDEANAYLRGIAATCAFALHGSLGIASTGDYIESTLRAPAAALGRLMAPPPGDMLVTVDNETLLNASSVTWSQLRPQPTGNPTTDCVETARFLFPDRIDAEHFDLMVTPQLYKRLHEITETLRAAVAHVVQNTAAVAAVFMSPSAVASKVMSTTVRIAGAPRGTWAGIPYNFPDGEPTSDDGPMLMAVKAAKAMYTSRMDLLFRAANVCDGPPVYTAMEANAYIYPGGDCTHVLLGVLRKPFADERYDNASLASRAGYVIAHELAHNSLVTAWNEAARDSLLSRYTANLHNEAIADLISALAIIHSGLATATEVCDHVSQVWCARVPMGYTPNPLSSHPGPNERGDYLCGTLSDMGFM